MGERESFGERANRKLEWFLYWVLLPVIAVMVLSAGVSFVRFAWPEVEGRGTVGTFTAKEQQCSTGRGGTYCTWYGDFAAGDGSITLKDVSMEGTPHGMAVGDVAIAVYTGDKHSVIGKGNQAHLVFGVVMFVGALAYLIGYVFIVFRRRRERRDRQRWQRSHHAHRNLR
jgi:hypothetical protein